MIRPAADASALPSWAEEARGHIWSREAEVQVLGGMLVDGEAARVAVESLDAGQFHRPGNREVFAAAAALVERGEVVDPGTVGEELKASGRLASAGGYPYLFELGTAVPTAATIDYHIRRVRHLAYLRSLVDAAVSILLTAQDAGTREQQEIHGAAEAALLAIAPAAADGTLVEAKALVWPRMEALEAVVKGRDSEPRVSTGLAALDRMLDGGMRRGKTITLAGRPSMGKSAMGVCNILADATIRQQLRALLFTPDADKESVVDRLIGSESRVNLGSIRRRRGMQDHEYHQLAAGTAAVHSARIHIDDRASPTVDDIRAACRKIRKDHGAAPDIVAVDYLQMLTAPQHRDVRQEINHISKHLKMIAREFHCVMLPFAQLSRRVEDRPDKRPLMSDLKESGNIEADADTILLLYRPEYYFGSVMESGRGRDRQEVNVEGLAEVIVAKNKDGRTGKVPLRYEAEYTKFADLEAH